MSKKEVEENVNSDDMEIVINKEKPEDIKNNQISTPVSEDSMDNLKLCDFPVTHFEFSKEIAKTDGGLDETILFYKWLK